MKTGHPMQPIGYDKHGVIRFKENHLVWLLLEHGRNHGFGLNELACIPATVEDRVQLAQLIGYSVSGFGELSYVPEKVVQEADRQAAILYRRRHKKKVPRVG